MKLRQAAPLFSILTLYSFALAQDTPPVGELPKELAGMTKLSEEPIGFLDNDEMRQAAEQKKISCRQKAVFLYQDPAQATQSLNNWLTAQHLQAQAVAENLYTGHSDQVHDSDHEYSYWMANNEQFHYVGMWAGTQHGGKLSICSGYPATTLNIKDVPQSTSSANTPRRHGGWLWLFAIIVGSAIARKASKGFSRSDLD